MREVGYSVGMAHAELIEGDVTKMDFDSGQFDLVCAFGVLHHVRHPAVAVSEMLRVAQKAIFISDSNTFGQGSLFKRTVKQLLHSVKLWRVANFIKTRGRGYTISEGDGLAYSYSVFDNYKQIKAQCKSIHVLNTRGSGPNLYRSADVVALLGIK